MYNTSIHTHAHSYLLPLLNDPLPPDNASRFTAPSCLARFTTTSERLAIPARPRTRELSWQACEGSPGATSGTASWWTSWCSSRNKPKWWSLWNNLCTHIRNPILTCRHPMQTLGTDSCTCACAWSGMSNVYNLKERYQHEVQLK